MSKTRIYQNSDFILNETVKLSDDAFGHIVRVLRLIEGDVITLFNGNDAYQYTARLVDVKKKDASVEIISQEIIDLILHELGHYAGHHTEMSYHKLLTKMAGQLVIIALNEKDFFRIE